MIKVVSIIASIWFFSQSLLWISGFAEVSTIAASITSIIAAMFYLRLLVGD